MHIPSSVGGFFSTFEVRQERAAQESPHGGLAHEVLEPAEVQALEALEPRALKDEASGASTLDVRDGQVQVPADSREVDSGSGVPWYFL